jgi:hypothetical protein
VARRLEQRDYALKDFADAVVKLAKLNTMRTITKTNSRGNKYKTRISSSGTLRDGIASELKVRTKDGRFSKGYIDFGFKGAAAEYGASVEFGRKAGSFPPVEPIAQWIKKKPLKLRDIETGQFLKKATDKKAYDRQIAGLAFIIARSIAKRGQQPTNFFSEAYYAKEEQYSNEIGKQIADETTEYIAFNIDKINE